MTLPPILDVAQAAELLRCAHKTVQQRARDGDLPGLKWGEDWVFPTAAFLQRLDELAVADAAERRKPQRPTGQLVDIKAGPPTGRGRRRTPPALPTLPLSAAAPPDPRPADSRT